MLTEQIKKQPTFPSEQFYMSKLLERVQREGKLQDAIIAITHGRATNVSAIQELSALHDTRSIKPLLQQAISGNTAVRQEAVVALRQYNPTLLKFYASELRREYYSNPLMTGKISELLASGDLSPHPRSARTGL